MTRTELLKIAKPILFNGEMVRAILAGSKTMTRRVIKPQTVTHSTAEGMKVESLNTFFEQNKKDMNLLCVACAPYRSGDILYVRETFFREDCTPDCAGREDDNECPFNRVGDACYGYKTQYIGRAANLIKWRPSIHMPKEAARIFLRVTGVRAERLWDITPEDCAKEGIYRDVCYYNGHKDCNCIDDFSHLWNSTIKSDDLPLYGWDANPWVWVYEFERVTVE